MIALVMLLAIAAILILATIPGTTRARVTPANVKDSISQRGLIMAITQWTQNNADRWPISAGGAGPSWGNNTTANLYWALMLQQLVKPDSLVSPAERNPNVRPYRDGEVFSVDLSSPGVSHASYAHMQPSDARSIWFSSYSSSAPIISTRFSEVGGISARKASSVTTPFTNAQSFALGVFGVSGEWSGNVAYADGHVEFQSNWLGQGGVTDTSGLPTYTDADGQTWPDLPYFDEQDDPKGTNHFLGIFTKAGRDRGDFVAVYD